jgi:pimeloyl-ACP methyl ester carboxylesterase
MSPTFRPAAVHLALLAAIGFASCSTPAAIEETSRTLTHLPAVEPSIPPLEATTPDHPTHEYVSAARLEQGYTIVVVGVNGDNMLSAGLSRGIVEGGYSGAVEVVDWTTGHWPLFVYHLRSTSRHDNGARAIGERVVAYRRGYPGREINLVAFSAGAAVALEALEELPESEAVDRLVLLAGAVSPAHDLRPALARCRVGLWNYYQPQDVIALWAGTIMAGTADGHHLMSAGAVGFWPHADFTEAEQNLVQRKLVQMPFEPRMALSGNLGGHFHCVNHRFVAEWIAPVLERATAAGEAQMADRPSSSTQR